ncbi:glyoxylate/hydroxypyruvate reductase HPR3 [Rhodamnia argentea]|uniref:Glyoxylate/hydroxypyruvate reductase HPR3 n=1 Tax=Rhodamnia argentea TaxID=178133 RepID=A0A8B8NRZ1_9MYRT|nr:glyoxylate/hydroxypyruvate reductase HPR3 [Rhodamnia argentea]
MSSQPEPGTEPGSGRPDVLVHRFRSFDFPFQASFRDHFTILDPWTDSPDEPADAFLARRAGGARALVCVGPTPLPADTLRLLPSLQVVIGTSAGVDHIDLRECRRRGIAVTNAGAAFAEDAADYAVALLLDVLRRMSAADRYLREGLWLKNGNYPLGFKLGGKRVGIVGLGNIGSHVAKRLQPFGCDIAYNSRSKKPSCPFPYYASIHDLASNSDVLILCCALTEETHHVINREVMTVLGDRGVIINVGRGSLIDEKELVQSLLQGELGGAGLDVFEDEPNMPKELFGLDNVVLSPHRAVITPESFEAMRELTISNLKAFFSNEPLSCLVQHK